MSKLSKIRRWMKSNAPYILFVWGGWVVGLSLIIRFLNPAMTETQLLINFFPWWILAAVVTITVFMLVGE